MVISYRHKPKIGKLVLCMHQVYSSSMVWERYIPTNASRDYASHWFSISGTLIFSSIASYDDKLFVNHLVVNKG